MISKNAIHFSILSLKLSLVEEQELLANLTAIGRDDSDLADCYRDRIDRIQSAIAELTALQAISDLEVGDHEVSLPFKFAPLSAENIQLVRGDDNA